MIWTKKEQEAVQFSFRAHREQKRKGTDIAYVSHPMIVGLILARLNADIRTVIAGILHDIIEDTDFNKRDIKDRFGAEVAELVEEVSETDRDLPYKERKERAAAKLYEVSDEAVLIKAADVLSNMIDLKSDLNEEGESAFNIFHADKNEKIIQIERVVKILISQLKNEELISNLKETFNEIKKYED